MKLPQAARVNNDVAARLLCRKKVSLLHNSMVLRILRSCLASNSTPHSRVTTACNPLQ
jgi:hypothetical protein